MSLKNTKWSKIAAPRLSFSQDRLAFDCYLWNFTPYSQLVLEINPITTQLLHHIIMDGEGEEPFQKNELRI